MQCLQRDSWRRRYSIKMAAAAESSPAPREIDRVIQTVITPKHVLTYEESGRAEHATLLCLLGDAAQLGFVVIRLSQTDKDVGRKREAVQNFPDHHFGADILIVSEIGKHNLLYERGQPRLVDANECDASGEHRVARKLTGPLPRQAELPALALHVFPDI